LGPTRGPLGGGGEGRNEIFCSGPKKNPRKKNENSKKENPRKNIFDSIYRNLFIKAELQYA